MIQLFLKFVSDHAETQLVQDPAIREVAVQEARYKLCGEAAASGVSRYISVSFFFFTILYIINYFS
jgi:hypothetical protein